MVASARLLLPGSQDVALFKEGFPANDAIKLMAEDGDNSALLVRAGGLRWFYSCSSYAGASMWLVYPHLLQLCLIDSTSAAADDTFLS